jgi:hypothetical protein
MAMCCFQLNKTAGLDPSWNPNQFLLPASSLCAALSDQMRHLRVPEGEGGHDKHGKKNVTVARLRGS